MKESFISSSAEQFDMEITDDGTIIFGKISMEITENGRVLVRHLDGGNVTLDKGQLKKAMLLIEGYNLEHGLETELYGSITTQRI